MIELNVPNSSTRSLVTQQTRLQMEKLYDWEMIAVYRSFYGTAQRDPVVTRIRTNILSSGRFDQYGKRISLSVPIAPVTSLAGVEHRCSGCRRILID